MQWMQRFAHTPAVLTPVRATLFQLTSTLAMAMTIALTLASLPQSAQQCVGRKHHGQRTNAAPP